MFSAATGTFEQEPILDHPVWMSFEELPEVRQTAEHVEQAVLFQDVEIDEMLNVQIQRHDAGECEEGAVGDVVTGSNNGE